MLTTPSSLALVSAFIGASTYAHAAPLAEAAPIPPQALAELRRAQVDIYCSHNDEAVAHIRAAVRHLRASVAVQPQTFAALDEAAWLTRHNQYVLAEQALDQALLQIVGTVATV